MSRKLTVFLGISERGKVRVTYKRPSSTPGEHRVRLILTLPDSPPIATVELDIPQLAPISAISHQELEKEP